MTPQLESIKLKLLQSDPEERATPVVVATITFEVSPAIAVTVTIPSPFVEVAKVDPSEAIHSEEIVSAIEARFQVKEFNFSGGTLLQYMLQDIAGNFRTEDSEAMDMLDLLFEVEKTLVDAGDLLPHFALIVAQP